MNNKAIRLPDVKLDATFWKGLAVWAKAADIAWLNSPLADKVDDIFHTNTVDVQEGRIGPDHEPHGTTTVLVTGRNAKGPRLAIWYYDELGTVTVKLFQNDAPCYEATWRDGSNSIENKNARKDLRDRYTMWVGVSPEGAQRWFNDKRVGADSVNEV